MDYFQKLFGYKEPTLIVAESESWTTLEWTEDLQRAIARRAKKEKWPEPAGRPHEFHCLLVLHGGFSDGVLEVSSLGSALATLPHEKVADLLERMRADEGLRATAVKATAIIDEEGRYRVEVNV